MVILGELDEATTRVMSRELAAGLSDATFVELRGCAHVPQLQEPELFLATVAPFLGILFEV
jgi:3-oxoadipate enol-lactonase